MQIGDLAQQFADKVDVINASIMSTFSGGSIQSAAGVTAIGFGLLRLRRPGRSHALAILLIVVGLIVAGAPEAGQLAEVARNTLRAVVSGA